MGETTFFSINRNKNYIEGIITIPEGKNKNYLKGLKFLIKEVENNEPVAWEVLLYKYMNNLQVPLDVKTSIMYEEMLQDLCDKEILIGETR